MFGAADSAGGGGGGAFDPQPRSHSHSTPKGHAGKVVMQLVDKIYDQMVPGFEDVFDEESFYVFAACFTLVTCIAAFVASRYITIKAKD